MRKLLGYSLFCIGLGMIFMWLLPGEFFKFILIGIFLLVGYYLFCCCKK